MIKAVVAVRHSKATGSARAVLLALATYTDEDGNNAFPKWETLARDSGQSRPTVHRAIKAALAAGEIECTGQRKSKTKVYSFAPLIHSLTLRRSHPETPIVSQGDVHSLTLRPDQAVIKQGTKKQQKNPRDAMLVGNTGLSLAGSSNSNGKAKLVDAEEIKAAQDRHAREERERLESELATLIAQQEKKPSERTARAIKDFEAMLVA